MRKFNNWLALKLGSTLGSMSFFYFCVILDLLELPAVIKAASMITWVTYVSQSVIQLIALPILSVQQNLQNQQHAELHNAVKAIHTHLGIKHNSRKKL